MFPLSILYCFGEKNETNWQILGIISIKAAIFFYIGYFLFICFLCDCLWTNSQDLKILETLSTHWFSRVDTKIGIFCFHFSNEFSVTQNDWNCFSFDLLDTKTFYNFVDQDDNDDLPFNVRFLWFMIVTIVTITVEVRFV